MPTKKSNPGKRQTNKKKPSARAAATRRVAERPRAGGRAAIPQGENQRSQGRYPGETPLTGEDRPSTRAGGKKDARKVGTRGNARRATIGGPRASS